MKYDIILTKGEDITGVAIFECEPQEVSSMLAKYLFRQYTCGYTDEGDKRVLIDMRNNSVVWKPGDMSATLPEGTFTLRENTNPGEAPFESWQRSLPFERRRLVTTELDKAYDKGKEEGYELGLQEGRKQGYNEGIIA